MGDFVEILVEFSEDPCMNFIFLKKLLCFSINYDWCVVLVTKMLH